MLKKQSPQESVKNTQPSQKNQGENKQKRIGKKKAQIDGIAKISRIKKAASEQMLLAVLIRQKASIRKQMQGNAGTKGKIRKEKLGGKEGIKSGKENQG